MAIFGMYCSSCKETFEVKDKEEKTVGARAFSVDCEYDNITYSIIFVRCPHCNFVQTVQIDNAETKKLLAKSTKYLRQGALGDYTKQKKISLKKRFMGNGKRLHMKRQELGMYMNGKILKRLDNGKEILYTHYKYEQEDLKDETS